MFAYNTLTNAAREGARMAIVNQYKPSVIEHAKNQTAIVELDDPSVSVTYWQVGTDGNPDTSKPQCTSLVAVGCLAVVTFEATYHPITPIISNILFGSGVTFRPIPSCPSSTAVRRISRARPGRDGCSPCPKQP